MTRPNKALVYLGIVRDPDTRSVGFPLWVWLVVGIVSAALIGVALGH